MSFQSYKNDASSHSNYDVRNLNDCLSSNERQFITSVMVNSHHQSLSNQSAGYSNDSRKSEVKGKLCPDYKRLFSANLYHMLEYIEAEGLSHIASWQPHGRAFKIHKPNIFIVTIAPKYFEQTKFTSFQRQLNIYGFSRFTKGPDMGAYYHQHFLRGGLSLINDIVRTVKTETGNNRSQKCTKKEPDFYSKSIPMHQDNRAIVPQENPRFEMRTSSCDSRNVLCAGNDNSDFHHSHQQVMDSFKQVMNQPYSGKYSRPVIMPNVTDHTSFHTLQQDELSVNQPLSTTIHEPNELLMNDCLQKVHGDEIVCDELTFDCLLKILRESE